MRSKPGQSCACSARLSTRSTVMSIACTVVKSKIEWPGPSALRNVAQAVSIRCIDCGVKVPTSLTSSTLCWRS